MKGLPSRSALEAGGDMGLMAAAAVLTLLSGLSILVLLPLSLLVIFAGAPPGVALLWATAWVVAALVAAFYNAMLGLEVINSPSPWGVTRLILVFGVAVLTCPIFWFD